MDLQLLSQCGQHVKLFKQIRPEIHQHVAGTLSNNRRPFPLSSPPFPLPFTPLPLPSPSPSPPLHLQSRTPVLAARYFTPCGGPMRGGGGGVRGVVSVRAGCQVDWPVHLPTFSPQQPSWSCHPLHGGGGGGGDWVMERNEGTQLVGV